MAMRLTIIETGRAPGPLRDMFPRYPEMFRALLSPADEALTFNAAAVLDGEALPEPETCEAVLITGSPFGVYDSTPWMDPLRAFIRATAAAGTPLVGICFGHQIIADALGGDVRKSEKGWGIGRHTYEVLARRNWMEGAGQTVSLAVSHQDQVITPPKGVTTLARSSHTEHAMLAYDDIPAITIQGHPEFSDTYVSALYNNRRGKALTDMQVDGAIATLKQPVDSALVARWIARFLQTARR